MVISMNQKQENSEPYELMSTVFLKDKKGIDSAGTIWEIKNTESGYKYKVIFQVGINSEWYSSSDFDFVSQPSKLMCRCMITPIKGEKQ